MELIETWMNFYRAYNEAIKAGDEEAIRYNALSANFLNNGHGLELEVLGDFIQPEDVKRKISKSRKGYKQTLEHIENAAKTRRGGRHHGAVTLKYRGEIYDTILALANELGMGEATLRYQMKVGKIDVERINKSKNK